MIETKPTLAGLAEALNTLLANGVDPDAEVMTGVYEEDGQRGTIVFDGVVDVETIGADSRLTRGRKLRVIIGTESAEESAHEKLLESAYASGREVHVTTYHDGKTAVTSRLIFRAPEDASECARVLAEAKRKTP